jgi:hypothetical protein
MRKKGKQKKNQEEEYITKKELDKIIEKKVVKKDEFGAAVFLGVILIGTFICTIVLFALGEFSGVDLDQQTVDDICYNLTSVEGVEGGSRNGKLLCEVPSFDSTNNILIKKAGEQG